MNWIGFSKKFHPSWHKHMRPFIESAECDLIFGHLKSRGSVGHRIMPISHNTFKAFQMPLGEIKVVILGGNPYDGYIKDVTLASGHFLDCSHISNPSYELQNFYKGIENELFNGLKLDYVDDQSTQYLTKQGVMMLNAALTTEEDLTHEDVWESFTKHVIKKLDTLNVPIIFIGELAQSYAAGIKDRTRTACLDDLPGTMVGDWQTGHVFEKVDEFVEENGHMPIMWLNTEVPF
jgi:uracil-DNA glycosylase